MGVKSAETRISDVSLLTLTYVQTLKSGYV